MLTAQKENIFILLFISLSQNKVVADGTEAAWTQSQLEILLDRDYVCSQSEIDFLFSFFSLGAHNSATKA